MEFSDKDRRLILKIAREMQLLKADVASLKKSKSKAVTKDYDIPEDVMQTIRTDTLKVVFGDNDWNQQEREIAIKTMYETIKDLCSSAGIVQFDVSINLRKEGI